MGRALRLAARNCLIAPPIYLRSRDLASYYGAMSTSVNARARDCHVLLREICLEDGKGYSGFLIIQAGLLPAVALGPSHSEVLQARLKDPLQQTSDAVCHPMNCHRNLHGAPRCTVKKNYSESCGGPFIRFGSKNCEISSKFDHEVKSHGQDASGVVRGESI
ncbi:hypothetical protein K474DRAFT_185380 [Panus rudis PR-1116 ss-1]|nr:hypothetical protein K474DRAFT_185380 [Panus rudis PR-1116 ss-1]